MGDCYHLCGPRDSFLPAGSSVLATRSSNL
jgi:hypothetical protein